MQPGPQLVQGQRIGALGTVDGGGVVSVHRAPDPLPTERGLVVKKPVSEGPSLAAWRIPVMVDQLGDGEAKGMGHQLEHARWRDGEEVRRTVRHVGPWI